MVFVINSDYFKSLKEIGRYVNKVKNKNKIIYYKKIISTII